MLDDRHPELVELVVDGLVAVKIDLGKGSE